MNQYIPILLFLSSIIFAQIDTTKKEFFPLVITMY